MRALFRIFQSYWLRVVHNGMKRKALLADSIHDKSLKKENARLFLQLSTNGNFEFISTMTTIHYAG